MSHNQATSCSTKRNPTETVTKTKPKLTQLPKPKTSMGQEAKTEKEKQGSSPVTLPPWKSACSQKRNFKKHGCPLSSMISVLCLLHQHQCKLCIHKPNLSAKLILQMISEIYFLNEELVNAKMRKLFVRTHFYKQRNSVLLSLSQCKAFSSARPRGNLWHNYWTTTTQNRLGWKIYIPFKHKSM